MHNSVQRFDIADFHSPTDKAKPGAKIQKKKEKKPFSEELVISLR